MKKQETPHMHCTCEPLTNGFLYRVTGVPAGLTDALQSAYFRPEGDAFVKNCPGSPGDMARVEPIFARLAPDAFAAHGKNWKRALLSFCRAANDAGLSYTVFGSSAFALRGVDLQPRDIDVLVAEEDFQRARDLFADAEAEPFLDFGDALLLARHFGRLCLSDTWLDVSAGPKPALRLGSAETVECEGVSIPLQTIDAALAAYDSCGQAEKAADIRRRMG